MDRLLVLLFLATSFLLGGCSQNSSSSDEDDRVDPSTIERASPLDLSQIPTHWFYEHENQVNFLVPQDWAVLNDFELPEGLLAAFAEPVEFENDFYRENIVLGKVKASEWIPLHTENQISKTNALFGVNEAELFIHRTYVKMPEGKGYWLETATIAHEINEEVLVLQYTAEIRRFDRYLNLFKETAKSVLLGQELAKDLRWGTLKAYSAKPVVIENSDQTFIAYCKEIEGSTAEIYGGFLENDQLVSVTLIDSVKPGYLNPCNEAELNGMFDGSNYLVTYVDKRTAQVTTHDRVVGKRISPNGMVLDSSAILISTLIKSGDVKSPTLMKANDRVYSIWYETFFDFDNPGVARPYRIVAADVSNLSAVGSQFTLMDLSTDGSFVASTNIKLKAVSNEADILLVWAKTNDDGEPTEKLRVSLSGLDGSPSMETPVSISSRSFSQVSVSPITDGYDIYQLGSGVTKQNLSSNGVLGVESEYLSADVLPAQSAVDFNIVPNEFALIANSEGVYYIDLNQNISNDKRSTSLPIVDSANTRYTVQAKNYAKLLKSGDKTRLIAMESDGNLLLTPVDGLLPN